MAAAHATRLSKLVPLLGSPVDGEALGAARAIDRALKAGKLDWHDMAADCERGWTVPGAVIGQQSAPLKEWQSIARDCLFQGGGILNSSEADFLRNIAARHNEPSEKQWRWLDAIAAALKGAVTE